MSLRLTWKTLVAIACCVCVPGCVAWKPWGGAKTTAAPAAAVAGEEGSEPLRELLDGPPEKRAEPRTARRLSLPFFGVKDKQPAPEVASQTEPAAAPKARRTISSRPARPKLDLPPETIIETAEAPPIAQPAPDYPRTGYPATLPAAPPSQVATAPTTPPSAPAESAGDEQEGRRDVWTPRTLRSKAPVDPQPEAVANLPAEVPPAATEAPATTESVATKNPRPMLGRKRNAAGRKSGFSAAQATPPAAPASSVVAPTIVPPMAAEIAATTPEDASPAATAATAEVPDVTTVAQASAAQTPTPKSKPREQRSSLRGSSFTSRFAPRKPIAPPAAEATESDVPAATAEQATAASPPSALRSKTDVAAAKPLVEKPPTGMRSAFQPRTPAPIDVAETGAAPAVVEEGTEVAESAATPETQISPAALTKSRWGNLAAPTAATPSTDEEPELEPSPRRTLSSSSTRIVAAAEDTDTREKESSEVQPAARTTTPVNQLKFVITSQPSQTEEASSTPEAPPVSVKYVEEAAAKEETALGALGNAITLGSRPKRRSATKVARPTFVTPAAEPPEEAPQVAPERPPVPEMIAMPKRPVDAITTPVVVEAAPVEAPVELPTIVSEYEYKARRNAPAQVARRVSVEESAPPPVRDEAPAAGTGGGFGGYFTTSATAQETLPPVVTPDEFKRRRGAIRR